MRSNLLKILGIKKTSENRYRDILTVNIYIIRWAWRYDRIDCIPFANIPVTIHVYHINDNFRMYHLHIQWVQNKYCIRIPTIIITNRIKSNIEQREYLMNTPILTLG